MKQTNVLFVNYCFFKRRCYFENKEQFILNEIKNPFITQQELAERIGLSRPATANIISGLIKRNIY